RMPQLELAHARLLEMALQDQLTRLPNRIAFPDCLAQALAQARSHANYRFAVLFLDCDRFKMINDSLGHSKGDQLLTAVADRLRAIQQTYAAQVTALARFGGDEFALLITQVADSEAVRQIAETVLAHLSNPFTLSGRSVYINASIGLVWGSPCYDNAEYILRDADAAMYRAKASGKGQYRWFESSMHNRAVQLLQLDTDLRAALARKEFKVYYQPILNLRRQRLVGFEALVRWWHPTEGFVLPARFIPFSEEIGLINDIGEQVLWQACRALAEWQRLQLVNSDFTLSVNLSTQQLQQPDVVNTVSQIVHDTGLYPNSLRLELTESTIIDNCTFVDDVLRALRLQQIQLSIDDFGTGYSSLSYLHTLPVNFLKVDRSFVQPITACAKSLGIVPLIVNIAHTMGLQVIAEGIETEIQLQQLCSLGCEYGQGYFFHEPVSADEALTLLSSPLGRASLL
ncbi:MAG: bifunctional diguanylate cyclase/phosphodiesterase, partial [Leptolyngbya sp. SIO4C1]|nr:bifunctional diguanylate cyclase/phosphodiesterase [Leptolyngbya sp. SIO4C1]